jgi:hypothetical protein
LAMPVKIAIRLKIGRTVRIHSGFMHPEASH